MEVTIENLTAKRFQVICEPNDSIRTVKERVEVTDSNRWNKEFDLIYHGKRLSDDCVLSDCIVKKNPVFYAVLKVLYPGG